MKPAVTVTICKGCKHEALEDGYCRECDHFCMEYELVERKE